MTKTFTVAEAQTLLPVLEGLLRGAQRSYQRINELDAEMQALNQRIFLSGGMHVDVVAAARAARAAREGRAVDQGSARRDGGDRGAGAES